MRNGRERGGSLPGFTHEGSAVRRARAVATGVPARRPTAWPALTLVTGVALVSGYAAGRRRKTTPAPAVDLTTHRPRADIDDAAREPEPPPGGLFAEVPPTSHRLRPDVLLGPVLLVMIGVIVDRLRESDSGESVTAWLLMIGATVAALLARAAGYRSVVRTFYLFLLGFSWAAAALYVQSGLGAVPEAWVSSTLVASLLWFSVDLQHRLRRADRGHKLRAALVAGRRWFGFFLAWAVVAQLIYLYVTRTLGDTGQQPLLAWLSVIAVIVLGGAGIVVLTVGWPARRR